MKFIAFGQQYINADCIRDVRIVKERVVKMNLRSEGTLGISFEMEYQTDSLAQEALTDILRQVGFYE